MQNSNWTNKSQILNKSLYAEKQLIMTSTNVTPCNHFFFKYQQTLEV